MQKYYKTSVFIFVVLLCGLCVVAGQHFLALCPDLLGLESTEVTRFVRLVSVAIWSVNKKEEEREREKVR